MCVLSPCFDEESANFPLLESGRKEETWHWCTNWDTTFGFK